MGTPLTTWRDRAAAFLAAAFKGAWYLECDACGTTLKKGRRTRWFLTREAADRAGLEAGWKTAASGSDSEICPACLERRSQAADLRIYRTELSRSSGGQWTLSRDGAHIQTTWQQDMDPAAAKEWASAVLGNRDTEWLNGRYEPDGESRYWVAEPEDTPAGES